MPAPDYDVVIIGGGPAGVSAAVYAARKQLKTILLTDDWGGQSSVSPEIQNWIGETSISGADLAKKLKTHVEQYKGPWLDICAPHRATGIVEVEGGIEVTCTAGHKHRARTAFIATGSNRRKLEVPGAAEYDQKGLTYCASCDGPLFGGMDVAVVGGGNAAFETAMQLLAYCKSVTLLTRGGYRADELTVQKVLQNPKFKGITDAQTVAVEGEQFVTGLRYKDSSGEQHLAVSGIFVEIGLVPNTEWLGDIVKKTDIGQVVADPYSQKTSHARIWAAGDCTDGKFHQNNIAAGDAVKALEDIYLFVHHER